MIHHDTHANDTPENGHPEPSTPLRVVLLGGDITALGLVPRLISHPLINLTGLLPTAPTDLIHNLEPYGYRVAEPCAIALYQSLAQVAEGPLPDLIIDTTQDPATVQGLIDAGLQQVARINPAALDSWLYQRSASPRTPTPPQPTNGIFIDRLTREVARAYRHERSLGLIVLRFAPLAPSPETKLEVARVRAWFEQALRMEDMVHSLPDGSIVIMLPETGGSTHHVADRLTSHLADFRIAQGASEPPAWCCATGWAWFPQDAKTAPALLEQAKARLSAALPLGG